MVKHIVAVHDKEKPFVCDMSGCEFRCSQSSNLSTHYKQEHGRGDMAVQFKDCRWCGITLNRLHIWGHESRKHKDHGWPCRSFHYCPVGDCTFRHGDESEVKRHALVHDDDDDEAEMAAWVERRYQDELWEQREAWKEAMREGRNFARDDLPKLPERMQLDLLMTPF